MDITLLHNFLKIQWLSNNRSYNYSLYRNLLAGMCSDNKNLIIMSIAELLDGLMQSLTIPDMMYFMVPEVNQQYHKDSYNH